MTHAVVVLPLKANDQIRHQPLMCLCWHVTSVVKCATKKVRLCRQAMEQTVAQGGLRVQGEIRFRFSYGHMCVYINNKCFDSL